MFFSKAFSLLILAFLHRSCTLRVEIDVGTPEGKQVKLICLPNKLNGVKKNALWEGIKLGIHDLHKLAIRKAPVPNIRVNSNRLKCYLKNSKKFRVEREIAGTVQTENGNCPPGYRIDQDRCYPCFPGSYTSGQETECTLCPRNFYISKEAADSCWPCPEGAGTTKEGASSVDACVELGSNNFRAGIGHIYKWYIIGILLIFFLLISWIIIIYLLIRYSCLDYLRRCFGRKEIITTKDDTFLMTSTSPALTKHIADEQFLDHDENILDQYHMDDSAAKRKSLKFDVDIKGSAVFTHKGSAEIDGVDNRGSKRSRKDTISLIQSSGIKDSPSPEQSPEIKIAPPKFEKNKENRADSQNIKNSNDNNLFKNYNIETDLQNDKTQRDNYVNESASITSNIQKQSIDDENINAVRESISAFNATEDLKYPKNSENLNLVNDLKHDTEAYGISNDNKIMNDDRDAIQINNSKHPSGELRKGQNNTTDSFKNSNQVNDKNLNEEIIDKAGKNKTYDNYGHLNQVNDLKLDERVSEKAEKNKMIDNESAFGKKEENAISNKNSKDIDNITESEDLEETSSNTVEKSETQEETSSSGTEKSSAQEEISAQNVKDSKNGISGRNSLIDKKNSIFEFERKPLQNENGKTQQNSFYYPSHQNRLHQVEQILSGSSFRKLQNNSCKKPSYCIRRSTDGHIHSDESLNSRFRKSSTDSSTSDTNSIAQKWLNNSKRTFPAKSDDKLIRITIEPEQEEEKMFEKSIYSGIPQLVSSNHGRSITERITIEPKQEKIEKKFEKKLHSNIPQFISSKQGRSVTERTSCSIHQDINSPAPPCHVEIVLLHLPG